MVCTPCFWQSGKIADNEQSDLTTKVFGAGKIGFWWRVDCEKVRTYKWDHLAFFVDNVEVAWTNGVTEWAYLEFAVDGSQEHELIWRYQKDVEGSDGEDCGAVCAIVWTPRLETLEDYAGATNMTLKIILKRHVRSLKAVRLQLVHQFRQQVHQSVELMVYNHRNR